MIHPQFNPIAFSVGFFSVHWYGLMYLLAFILFIIVCRIQIKQQFKAALNFNHQDIEDILFFGAIGVILGGRLGYILFYKLNDYLAHPLDIVKIWQGGMSFHGGFLGVVLALIIWAKLHKKSILEIGDFVVPAVPLGLAAGRIGNFINGELWGRPTDPQAWWAMVFPQAGDITAHIARHPSQLYQAALEGIGLFIIVWLFARRTQIKQDTIKQDVLYGKISGVFIAGYGICRLIVEFAREPDSYLGLLNLGLSMGQWLSLPMIIIGGILYFRNSLYKYI